MSDQAISRNLRTERGLAFRTHSEPGSPNAIMTFNGPYSETILTSINFPMSALDLRNLAAMANAAADHMERSQQVTA